MAVVDRTFKERYRRDGFFTVEKLLAAGELQTIRERMEDVAHERIPYPKSDLEYEPGLNGAWDASRLRKINRCAEQDEVFRAHAANERILELVTSLIGPDVKLFGSQCFMKPPGGVEKPYHQDSAYFTIDPPEIVTCWTALDKVTVENGCLWVIPGSHQGPLRDHQPWQLGDRIDKQVPDDQLDRTKEVAVELSAGSCSFHHSMLLHRSGPNQTQHPRRGLAVHYMSARSRWTHPTNPQPTYPLLCGQEYEGCV